MDAIDAPKGAQALRWFGQGRTIERSQLRRSLVVRVLDGVTMGGPRPECVPLPK